jgi:hypothetical protein
MINRPTYSLEEVSMSFDGRAEYPVICEACYQGIMHEPKRRSCPRSYAALAQDSHTYQVQDWNGMGTNTCRCCGTREYAGRWSVMPVRKP